MLYRLYYQTKKSDILRYEIRYIYVRSKADKKQLDLAHGIKNRKKQGKVKKTSCSEETIRIIVRGGSPEERSESMDGMI